MKIPVAEPDITPEDVGKVAECCASGWVSGISPYVDQFEKRFAEWNDNKYGVATGSGTTALHLALAALDLPKRSEVIMPSFTMIATANACHYLGLKPVFCEVDPYTWCMSPLSVEMAVTEKTSAIMPVHVYGYPCDMSRIMEIAWNHDLKVVEDCAEAHGAEFKRKRVGTFGDVGCYSFYANKIITTGEGGMIVTDDEELAEKMKWLRAHAFGRHGKHYWHEDIGYGYRMGGLQASLGLSQMDRIDYYIEKRRINAWIYKNFLKDSKLPMSIEREGCKNVYWMFSVLLPEKQRKPVMDHLEKKGIETRTFFYPLHDLPPYKTEEKLPITHCISEKGINLPSGNKLGQEQIEYVCENLLEVVK